MEKLEDRALLATLSLGPTGLHVAEGGTATLQATLSETQMQPVTLYYRTMPGTATENTDYTGVTNQSVTIPPGATFANISIQISTDSQAEPAETFSVALLGATGATINPAASSVAVTIDDVASGGSGSGGGTTTLTLSAPTNVGEGEAFSLTAQLSPPGVYQINVGVDWGATPGAGPVGFSGTTSADGSFTIAHQYFDDGPAPGNGTPQDVQSITLTGTATQFTMQGPVYYPLSGITSTTIHNVAPSPVFDIYNYMPVGGPWWKATGVYQDVGLTDRGTAVINWGDGSPDTVFTNLEVGDEFNPEVHRYPRHGLSYTITITLTDDDTGSVSYSEGFTLYLFDLDNDANDNGEINAIDEPYEPLTPGVTPPETSIPGPGRHIAFNGDDDNENGVYDYLDTGPVVGEDDLEPIDVIWQKPSRPDIQNYLGWRIILTIWPYSQEAFYQNPRIWLTPDKSGEPLIIHNTQQDEYAATWTVGGADPLILSNDDPPIPADRNADELSKRFYVEAGGLGSLGMRLRLRTPGPGGGGQLVEEEFIAFTPFPQELLTIYDGQEGPAIADVDEDITGAVTVANKNNTDADEFIDNVDTSVKELRTGVDKHGRDEVDLMRLDVLRGANGSHHIRVFSNLPERVAFWTSSTKESLLPLGTGGEVDIYFPNYTPKFKTIWVELKDVSSELGDVVITAHFYRLFEDKVIATGIWATMTKWEFATIDYANLAADPWRIEMDAHLQQPVKDVFGGTGKRPNKVFDRVDVGPPPEHISGFHYVILFQFEFKPFDIQASLPRVKFDPTRQKAGVAWVTMPDGEVRRDVTNTYPYPIEWERPNDDGVPVGGPENDESHEPFQNSHVYAFDAPGMLFNDSASEAYVKQARKTNFWEWMRVRLDGVRPGLDDVDNAVPAAIEGSICSPYTGWNLQAAIKKHDGTWIRDDALPNDIAAGHVQPLQIPGQ